MNKNTYSISSIKRVTRKFLDVSRCIRAKQRQRSVQKSVLHVQSCFLLIRPFVVFVEGGKEFVALINSPPEIRNKNRSKNKLVRENAVTLAHGICSLRVMVSWVVLTRHYNGITDKCSCLSSVSN